MTYFFINQGISRRYAVALIVSLFLGTLGISAQTLKGTILDARTHEPIIGAVVSVKNGKTLSGGTSTDINGNFTLAVKSVPATIVASYTGYNSEEINIYEITEDEIQIELTENFNALQGVVVVGYGTQKKSDLAGSIASVNVDKLNTNVTASVNSLLDGASAGLQVTPTSGQPGAGISLRIRGGASVQGGNEPLYVIDGLPVYNSSVSSGVFGSFDANNNSTPGHEGFDPLSSLNPGDIESVTILKDASATAIYGSRGANGVIIITTKTGKKGEKANITYDGSIGIQSLRKKFDVLDATEFAKLRNEALYVENPSLGSYQYKTADEIAKLGAGTDWQDEAFRSAIVTNHQLSVSGGTDKTHYSISGNYFNQEGILHNTGFTRLSARVNLDTQVSKKFKVGLNLTNSYLISNTPPASAVFAILQTPATVSARNADGSYFYKDTDFDTQLANPVAALEQETNKSNNNRILGSAFGEYEFIKNLKLKVLLGVDLNSTKEYYNLPSSLYEGATSNGTSTLGQSNVNTWVNENTLTYTKTFAEKHNFNFLVGFTQQETQQEIFTTGSSNYVSDVYSYNSLQSGSVIATPYSNAASNSLISYLGRVNYDYNHVHALSLSFRRDGSSRFGKDRKWGTFPSVGYTWNVIDEKFAESLKNTFSNLKLRLSYGKTGNQEIGNYQSLATLSSNKYILAGNTLIGYGPDRIANDDLGWETTYQFDAGLDFSFFNERLSFTVDYYNKLTKDLLLNVEIPYTSGYSTSLQNHGSVQNRGWEFGIISHNFIGKKFTWDTSFNISFNRNKVKDLGGSGNSYITNNYYWGYIIEEGKPLGSFYGAIYDGVLQSGEESSRGALTYNQTAVAGERVYKDIDGDGKFSNSSDRTVIGSAEADFTFSLSNNLTYKNWDLTFFINGSVGNDIANINKERLSLFTGKQNAIADAANRWTVDSPSTAISRAKYTDPASVFSSEFIEDGSFVRLKNVTLGYTFPKRFVKSLSLSKLRLYASVTNLLTITGYSGYDPEVTSADNALTAGTDFGAYPSARTWNFGLSVGF